MHQKTIVVFGGTGHYGQKIVSSLLTRNQYVVVVSRNRAKATLLLGNSVEIIEGDVRDPKIIETAIRNCDGIIISLSAMTSKLIRQMNSIERDAVLRIISEAERRKINRIIYLSGYEMRSEVLEKLNVIDFGEIKIEIEQRLKHSSLNWTIMGCAPMFELFFAFIKGNKMMVPGGGYNAIPTVSANDVGAICAEAILRFDLQNQRIRITGPKAYSFPDTAQIMSSIWGFPIRHKKIPLGVIKAISKIISPISPFPRYLYKSLKLLNNFPADLAEQVPKDFDKLQQLFNYKYHTLEEEILQRKEKFDN